MTEPTGLYMTVQMSPFCPAVYWTGVLISHFQLGIKQRTSSLLTDAPLPSAPTSTPYLSASSLGQLMEDKEEQSYG